MANTYTQIYIHIVFAVKYRQSLISDKFKNELYKYITGILKNKNQKLIAINGMSDHTHLFVGMKPEIAISDLVRNVKSNSSKFVNDKKHTRVKFEWQDGFGALSYSHSHIDKVVKYIQNQEEYHKKITFKEEYINLLKKFNIKYDVTYLCKKLI